MSYIADQYFQSRHHGCVLLLRPGDLCTHNSPQACSPPLESHGKGLSRTHGCQKASADQATVQDIAQSSVEASFPRADCSPHLDLHGNCVVSMLSTKKILTDADIPQRHVVHALRR